MSALGTLCSPIATTCMSPISTSQHPAPAHVISLNSELFQWIELGMAVWHLSVERFLEVSISLYTYAWAHECHDSMWLLHPCLTLLHQLFSPTNCRTTLCWCVYSGGHPIRDSDECGNILLGKKWVQTLDLFSNNQLLMWWGNCNH